MIVLIPPSKTFSNSTKTGSSEPVFTTKANILKKYLENKTLQDLISEFKVSPKLAKTVYEYYHGINQKVSAIYLYEGVLYKALKANTLNFNVNKLYIISALYGLVRPFDNIKKYRLDFTIKSLGNLYNYWRDEITNYFNNNYKDEIIINLTSKEFSPLLKDLNNLITIEFINKDNKRLSSVLLKQLRGYLANIIINNNILNTEELKKIIINDFSFNNDLSTKTTYYFCK